MSKSKLEKDIDLELVNSNDLNYLSQKNRELFNKNHELVFRNSILKKKVSELEDEKILNAQINDIKYKRSFTFKSYFYAQVIIAISVIILALAFHIVYLSITDCLFYTEGNSDCWLKSWAGITIHASFFIDLTLYLLIGAQTILVLLLIRKALHDYGEKQKNKTLKEIELIKSQISK
jgi:hypothetical protein